MDEEDACRVFRARGGRWRYSPVREWPGIASLRELAPTTLDQDAGAILSL